MFEHELKAAVAQMAGGEFTPPLRGGVAARSKNIAKHP
jgi:hypothetical protein